LSRHSHGERNVGGGDSAAAVQRIAARMNVETRGISIFVSAMALGLKAHLHALLRDEMIS
jgi:hypothetical protein